MTTYSSIPELDRKGLRKFGLTTGTIVAILFGLLFPWFLDLDLPSWPWAVLGILGLWAIIAPASLKPIYKMWMRFGLLLSNVTTPIIMGFVFFAVITPFGIIMKLFSKDPMRRRFDSAVDTYRIKSKKCDPSALERPF